MTRPRWLASLGLALVGVAAFAAIHYARMSSASDSEPTRHADQTPQIDSPGMCPWRSPQSDMRTFFPGASDYRQRLLVLSDLRSEVVKKLGPKSPIDANSIYCYQIVKRRAVVGSIVAQRTPGEYGAVEYVAAFDSKGRIAGVKIQRLREPAAGAKAIKSPTWLRAFRGRDADSGFEPGVDIPAVVPAAKITAGSLTDSIRRLTIEYDVALAHNEAGVPLPGGSPDGR